MLNGWRVWYFQYFEAPYLTYKNERGRQQLSEAASQRIRGRISGYEESACRKRRPDPWIEDYDRPSGKSVSDSDKKKHWHEVVSELKQEFPCVSLTVLCRFFGKTRQAWYKAQQARELADMKELLIVEQVEHIRKYLPRLGGRKLFFMLESFFKKHKIKIGRDKFFDLLRKYKLLIKRKKRRVRTTFSNHLLKKYPNQTHQLLIGCPNRVWVADITYIRVGKNFSYLSLITDAYSRKIVGHHLSPTLCTEGPLKALKMALKQRKDKKTPLIHHSDRGIQYCSVTYTGLLKKNQITISMTQSGDPKENALAERVHKTIKEEFLNYCIHLNHETANKAVKKTIELYNEMRPHASIDYLTPAQAHRCTGPIKRRWKIHYRSEKTIKKVGIKALSKPSSRA